ncbi:hypothetical protein BJ878DRAFT_558047 [Calycina marina]|uniref:Uncharacterized protein n=1 Tax=Calycina marina TaxID=1763456 RepID=A0A9P7YYH7_9HELO|nr:hypothetical protein BJ878DRAFT_558047 [Calycina marina]
MSGFDDLNQNVFGLVALIALQYFSTADGYRRCADSVMGLWAEGTHRRLRAKMFRVEVVFEIPVLFMASPNNKRGPIAGRDVMATKVLQPKDQAIKASWVNLLAALQREECDSRKWDESDLLNSPRGIGIEPPKYNCVVCLQGKTRSWDFIPDATTKPYATSTMCHLIEMISMLGMYWKAFDQVAWNLRAEGNGFILTSTIIHGLGVMVVFAITEKSTFTNKRVIPDEQVLKELAFGIVPNIFSDDQYLENQKEAQSLDLIFGTHGVDEETLEALGCSAGTLRKWSKINKHIFSMSFEIIGMLGQVLRIRGSSFRMNQGRKASWKMTTLIEVFQRHLSKLIDEEHLKANNRATDIFERWGKILHLGDCTDETQLNIECREAIHEAVDAIDKYLLTLNQTDLLGVVVAHITHVVDVLEDPNSSLNIIALTDAHKEETLITYYFDKIRPNVMHLPTDEDKEAKSTIWIALVFRMLCWFLLHDFDKGDVRIVPAEMKGSRMPVFIG